MHHLLTCCYRWERLSVGRILYGVRHGLVDIADVLRNGPRLGPVEMAELLVVKGQVRPVVPRALSAHCKCCAGVSRNVGASRAVVMLAPAVVGAVLRRRQRSIIVPARPQGPPGRGCHAQARRQSARSRACLRPRQPQTRRRAQPIRGVPRGYPCPVAYSITLARPLPRLHVTEATRHISPRGVRLDHRSAPI